MSVVDPFAIFAAKMRMRDFDTQPALRRREERGTNDPYYLDNALPTLPKHRVSPKLIEKLKRMGCPCP